MKHSHKRHRTIARIKKKFKNLAGMVAAATILSGIMLPSLPATAHAAADPNVGTTPTAASQQLSNTNQAGSPAQANLKGSDPSVTISHPTEKANQVDHSAQQNPKEDKSPTADSQKAEKTNPADNPAQQHSKNTKHDTDSSDKAPTNYKKVLDITATAYAPGAHDNDQWGDKTFMGTTVRPGIIAVDPSVIPLGSRVYIQYPDGHGEYAVAEDTGGAIKGNRIDIAKSTVHNAQDFGMKDVKVFVLDKVKT